MVLPICAASFYPASAYAKEPPQSMNDAALQSLARDFVSRIGGKLKTYDNEQKAKNADLDPLTQIPDGESLLLRPKSKDFVMDNEIEAIKYNRTIYYSLRDIISNLELAIKYNDEKKTGAGFFLREDWLVRFDFNKGEVVSRGTTYNVRPEDVRFENGITYISQAAAQQWLEITTKPDIAQQYLNIETPFPYPPLARNYRESRARGSTAGNVPRLPRAAADYKWLDINTAEIQQNLQVSSRKDSPTTVRHENTTTVEGDVLKHSLHANTFWDNDQQLTGVRARLTKEDENPVLLGPLKARSYSVGDTDIANVPLTGSSTQELGFRVSNNPLRNADFQQTTISGDSLPGWDVELYRDGVLLDRLRVGPEARYEFPDVQLFAGDNLFEVFYYGPSGEIRRDNFNIPVTEEYLATQDNTYDVSLSMSDTQVYNKFKSEDQDAQTPDLVARYNKIVGGALAYVGTRTKQIDGEQKVYLGSGITKILDGYIFDANLAADEKGKASGELSARKNIDDWRLSLRGRAKQEEFLADGEDNNIYSVLGNATKNFVTPFDTFLTVNASSLYGLRPDDSIVTSGQLGFSNQMGRFNLSTNTNYTNISNLAGSPDTTKIDEAIIARMNLGRYYVRGGLNYNIDPYKRIDNVFTQLSYQADETYSGDLYLERDMNSKESSARLTVNYKNDKFRLSPFLDVNTNSEVKTGVKLITTLVDQPGKSLPAFTSDTLVGRGQVSSFVYFDKNGNNIFDAGDEPLPEVYVESLNIARRAPTDEKGYSLIKDLPESIATDITVDKNTLPDPFMISEFEGVSVFPRAGQMTQITFPIHLAGEVDGNVIVDNQGSRYDGSKVNLSLIPIDSRGHQVFEARSADDGYYVMSNVPPGNYLLVPNYQDAVDLKAGGAKPMPIRIGFDGKVLSGQNVVLQKDRPQVEVKLEKIEANAKAPQKGPLFALETGAGAEQSRLSQLLSRMIERKENIDPNAGLTTAAMGKYKDLKIMPGKGWTDHYDRCQLLNDKHIPCRMIIFIQTPKKSTTALAQN